MCCKLKLKTLNNEKRQHHFGITGNIACVLIHADALHSNTFGEGGGGKVLHEI